jgi:hypothetical protein
MKTQTEVLRRLENETRREMRKLENQLKNQFLDLWFKTRIAMESVIAREYHQDFSGRNWDVAQANNRGTLLRMEKGIGEVLRNFTLQAIPMLTSSFTLIYHTEVLRSLWMLDQTTPASRKPKWPSQRSREASSPRDYRAGWDEALRAWVDAYDKNLSSDLRMEAVQEADMSAAIDRVAAAQIDNTDPANKFDALFTNQSIIAEADARDDVFGSNGDIASVEIWQTMEDGRVCDICDVYDGLEREEVDDDIPAHFNCRCFFRIVPADWANLLSSDDPDEKEAALRMMDEGLVPDAMAITGESGNLIGTATVSFDDWVNTRAADFYGQNIVGRAGPIAR